MTQKSNHKKTPNNFSSSTIIQAIQQNFKLNIQYEQNMLNFNWDLTDIPAANASSTRHILIFDIIDSQYFQIFKKIYNYAKLGDFIRIFNTRGKINASWIQKTSQQIKSDKFALEKKPTKDLLIFLEKILKKTSKFNQPQSILLFTQNKNILNMGNFEKLNQFKLKYKSYFIFNVFFLGVIENQVMKNTPKQLPFNLYECDNPSKIKQNIKVYFYRLSKIRISYAELRLFCYGKEIEIHDLKNSAWLMQDGYLIKNLYTLNNYTNYTEKIFISSTHAQKLGFQVQFTINLIENIKFKMNHIFYINVQNNLKSGYQINSEQQNIFNDYRYFSQIIRGSSLNYKVNGERIIIRQQFPQPICQYQKLIK